MTLNMNPVCSNNLGESVPYDNRQCLTLGIPGEWTRSGNNCVRRNFLGNPTQCLMSNMTGNSSCFDKIGATCAPNTRLDTLSVLTPNYQQTVIDYCSGKDGASDWMSRWYGDQSCTDFVYNQMGYISGVPEGCYPKNIDTDSLTISLLRLLINNTIANYVSEGYEFPAVPGTVGYNTFQERMYQISCDYPVLSNQALRVSCRNYSTNDLIASPALADVCGCYLNPTEYQSYISPQCSPTCNNNYAVKLTDLNNQLQSCQNDICYIGGDTIALVNSRGTVTINEVCGECTGQCNCIVSDNTIVGINTNNIDISLNAICGSYTSEDGTYTLWGKKTILGLGIGTICVIIIIVVVLVSIHIW